MALQPILRERRADRRTKTKANPRSTTQTARRSEGKIRNDRESTGSTPESWARRERRVQTARLDICTKHRGGERLEGESSGGCFMRVKQPCDGFSPPTMPAA